MTATDRQEQKRPGKLGKSLDPVYQCVKSLKYCVSKEDVGLISFRTTALFDKKHFTSKACEEFHNFDLPAEVVTQNPVIFKDVIDRTTDHAVEGYEHGKILQIFGSPMSNMLTFDRMTTLKTNNNSNYVALVRHCADSPLCETAITLHGAFIEEATLLQYLRLVNTTQNAFESNTHRDLQHSFHFMDDSLDSAGYGIALLTKAPVTFKNGTTTTSESNGGVPHQTRTMPSKALLGGCNLNATSSDYAREKVQPKGHLYYVKAHHSCGNQKNCDHEA
ncbi:hypothetical protein T265_06661 [Opisthorchis viverrini]|uniref:Uncharacterized protein n=1 Tax=Opisthorchis viverrini TaxID=6198 RepID=A0A074ZRQ3_OPIVI|nr:hypothetical protein T265_06661 [Opisthorchis viverrini]KER26025.1 hypothetical protein T265_06661 [Opisthorchis viverrini]